MNLREQREELERETLSARATKSAETRGRKVFSEKCGIRTDFQKDRDRITHSKAFRRLMHKTQVFISPEGDHYRTRLTHTLEVAQISRTAARALRLNEDLTEAIAFGHDLGHTPFGHTGEDALNSLLRGGFRHNEHSVRMVETLENDGRGLNLTFEVIDGILNHRTACKPATPEGRVVQLCDKIAYMNHDVDDAIRARILGEEDLPRDVTKILGNTPARRIDFLVRDLVSYSQDRDEISLSPETSEALREFRTFMFGRVYANQLHTKERAKIKEMLRLMFEFYLNNPQELPPEIRPLREPDNAGFAEQFFARQGDSDDAHVERALGAADAELREIDRKDGVEWFPKRSIQAGESLENAIADYIAGMTDRFAQKRFREIFLPNAWEA